MDRENCLELVRGEGGRRGLRRGRSPTWAEVVAEEDDDAWTCLEDG